MGFDVFLSYATPDKAWADKVFRQLVSQGIQCFYAPEHIPPGGKYYKHIMEAIRECSIAVFIVSTHAFGSENVETELERSFQRRKVLMPLRIENAELPDEWSYFISRSQMIDAFLPNNEKAVLEKLSKAVHECLKIHGERVATPDTPPETAPSEPDLPEPPAPATADLGSYKGVLFDTNRSYDTAPDYCDSFQWMVEKNRVSAFGDRKDAVKRLSKGDIVFYSHKWVGIVAAARVTGEKVEADTLPDGNDELHWAVEFLTTKPTDFANPPRMTFQQVKQATGKNFFWARIVKVPYLSWNEADKLVNDLRQAIGSADG